MREIETICLLEGRPYDENSLLISVMLSDVFYFTTFFLSFPTLKLDLD